MNSDTDEPQNLDEGQPEEQGLDRSATTLNGQSDESALDTLTPGEIDSLERVLGDFAAKAPVEEPHDLIQFLPDDSSAATSFVLVELIKLDMAAKAELGQVPRIEHYIDAMPELLSADSIPVDLVMEELQLRREAGEQPESEEYRRRFPKIGSVFGQLLAPPSSPLELNVGATIDDFFIVQTLGSGAFAQVYLARQKSMQRLVALKVSKGTGGESQALAKFDHPNVVRVFDQRNLNSPAVHLLYMQYLPGGTLSDVVKSVRAHRIKGYTGQVLLDAVDRQLLRAAQVLPERSSVRNWLATAPWPMVVAWVGVQLARALDSAHRNNIFHRDVKPANVLLSAEGIPKLADFNVSFSEASESTFGGSIGYMAPEHLCAIDPDSPGSPNDVREHADLYSLAILLWELWQGQRPFECDPAESRSDVIRVQLAARGKPLCEPTRCGGASERVLEATLREALSLEPADRPSSGAELAGRLKLALHPEAAGIFNPDADSVRAWLWRQAPSLVAGIFIMLPHIIVGIFNFKYNEGAMSHLNTTLEMKEYISRFHQVISNCFNAVVFPLGFLIMLWRIVPMVRAIKSVQRGEKTTPNDISATINLSQHAANIGGGFWIVAGLYYSLVLTLRFEEFSVTDGVQIFLSMVICGGIAATYPFFGLSMLGTLVYYPRFVRDTMQDPQFDRRKDQIISRSEAWLFAGAGVPLLGAALLISHPDDRKGFMLALVGLTAVGLLASFLAYKQIVRYWDRMSEVLSTSRTSVVPAAPDEE